MNRIGLNFERLDRAIDWAIAEDAKRQAGGNSLWNQEHWALQTPCGTNYCLAGNIVVHAGYSPKFTEGVSTALALAPEGGLEDIEAAALELLGGGYEVGYIFSSDNDIEAIKRYRDYFARRECVPTRFGFGEDETADDIANDSVARLVAEADAE